MVRTSRFILLAATLAAFGATVPAYAAVPPGYQLAVVGAYGGEPSITSDPRGVLYDTSPSSAKSGSTSVIPIYRSTDKGRTWTRIQEADSSSGDDCLATDQAADLYWCNLASTSQGALPLQADDWRSTVAATCTTDCKWVHGAGIAPVCSTSCSPFGVDRQWTAASIPPGKSADQAEVVLMYHDFYGATQIWVNISTDGGRTFGPPVPVLASPAVTPGGVTGSLVAEGYTFCNTVPAGVQIVPNGKPHAGRIYVGWIASDVPQDATGCNITMVQSFHTAWISYSDDGGSTWTAQQVIDMGFGHDMSTPFVAMTQDSEGNPYFAFAAQGQGQDPVSCAAESTAGTVQSDASCAYNMYVVWSNDGGSTWDGGGGLIPGSAAAPYQVNPPSEVGTHFYPAIAAAGPGQVDVAYLYTPAIVPTDPLGKVDPGGCAGPGPANGDPSFYPPTCDWFLYAGQSANLTAGVKGATWTTTRVTQHPMHYGDICNLGIFCVWPTSNRNLLDFIQATVDPTTGCAHIAYADDNSGALADPKDPSPFGNHLVAANQTSGCFGAVSAATSSKGAAASTPFTAAEESPLAPLAVAAIALGGLLIVAAAAMAARRRGA